MLMIFKFLLNQIYIICIIVFYNVIFITYFMIKAAGNVLCTYFKKI